LGTSPARRWRNMATYTSSSDYRHSVDRTGRGGNWYVTPLVKTLAAGGTSRCRYPCNRLFPYPATTPDCTTWGPLTRRNHSYATRYPMVYPFQRHRRRNGNP